MPTKTIDGKSIHYTVSVSTKRKNSVRLKITSSDTLEITVPRNYDRKQIDQILEQKSAWIARATERLKCSEAAAIETIQPGIQLPFLGRMYHVVFHEADTNRVDIALAENQIILISHRPAAQTGQDALKKALVNWYSRMAYQLLLKKTEHWGGIIGTRPSKISIRDPKTRWGSCSSKAAISYSWRIVMAPECVIDYLIVHELCHLRIPNHSPEYWSFLSRYIPDYKQRRHWLKLNGRILMGLLGR